MNPRIALCAGETSGDQLGAGLVEALRERFPDARFAGIGGDAMRAAGVDTWFDASELAVMGLAEVLSHLPRLLRLRADLRKRVLAWKPDVFVGIDAPDFNLGVEKWLKRRGVRTVHYVSPSVWAWRPERVVKIGDSADQVLCLFPMEKPLYDAAGVPATFVGHPLASEIPLQPDRAAMREQLGLPRQAPVFALMPGSRKSELEFMGGLYIEVARQLLARYPDAQFLVPLATRPTLDQFDQLLTRHKAWDLPIRKLFGHAQMAMIAADVVVLASGTATLEAMLVKRPMVVGYRVNELTYRLVKALGLIKVDRFALPNILAGQDLAPELMQHDCTPDRLAAAIQQWFDHPQRVIDLQDTYVRLHERLRRNASARAADAVGELLMRDRAQA